MQSYWNKIHFDSCSTNAERKPKIIFYKLLSSNNIHLLGNKETLCWLILILLCMAYLLISYSFMNMRKSRNGGIELTIPDLNETIKWPIEKRIIQMCAELTEQEETELFPRSNQKYILPFNHYCGGLGNQMYRFSSLFSVGWPHGRQYAMYGDFCLKCNGIDELEQLFPVYIRNVRNFKFLNKTETLFRRDYGSRSCCFFDNPERLNLPSVSDKFLVVGDVLDPQRGKMNFFQNYKYFHQYRPFIRKAFRLGPGLCEKMRNYSNTFFGFDKFTHKICVHTRNGDMPSLIASQKEFTEDAIQMVYDEMKKTHHNLAIILLGKDKEFLASLNINRMLIQHVYQSEALRRADDVAFALLNCDTLLITSSSSTYSWWLGYLLPEGSRIFYNGDHRLTWHGRDNFPSDWTALMPSDISAWKKSTNDSRNGENRNITPEVYYCGSDD